MEKNTRDFFANLRYGPAPEGAGQKAHAWLETHNRSFGHFINGGWQTKSTDCHIESLNPTTLETLAKVPCGDVHDIDFAMKAAEYVLPFWSKLPGEKRWRYLYAIARAINRHERVIAALETLDNGKPIREARIDVALAIRHFYHHAGWARLVGKRFPGHEPHGVVGAIIPWNFPLLMFSWKVAPAIAAGNTIVIKPAETTPLTALFFAELLKEEVDLPPGVVNIVFGAGETGSLIVNHPTPKKIAFTGSTEVGRLIRKTTAGSGKSLTLELGGKSPFIVFADADLDAAVDGVRNAIFYNQGHVCCAGSRLLVEESIATTFITKVKRMMSGLRIGNPLDKCTDIGAINSAVQLETIERYMQIAKNEGANIWQPDNHPIPNAGYFFPPTLCTNVETTAVIAQEEIFGPVLVIHTFRAPQEAIELANNTRYGLAASVWTENAAKMIYVDKHVRAGTVWNNCTNQFDANSGFGGYGESGFGREGGEEGILAYLREKPKRAPKGPRRTWRANPNILDVTDSVLDGIDWTSRALVGGKLKRPDGGTSFRLYTYGKEPIATIGDCNRKDVRDAVESAQSAFLGWRNRTAHNRAQILYFLAENLDGHKNRFASDINKQTGRTFQNSLCEVEKSIDRLVFAASMADKFEGRTHEVNTPNMDVVASIEPIGIIGIRAPDEYPLLGLVATMCPALAMGNTVVLIAGRYSLTAVDFIRIVQNSDVPAGVLNILTAQNPDNLVLELAKHENVDSVLCFSDKDTIKTVQIASADSNMKRTYPDSPVPSGWVFSPNATSDSFFRKSVQVKNTWTPYGV